MNKADLSTLSLTFRRASSNLLNSNHETADVNLARFLKLINDNDLIHSFISQKIYGVEYDFKKCFGFDNDGWAENHIPEDEACHIKAQYDYMTYIHSEKKTNVLAQAMRYCWSDNSFNSMIENFLVMAFKPLIDFINDQLSMQMIVIEAEMKVMSGNTFIQNIETINGSANQQVSGSITTYSTTNDIGMMMLLVEKLILSLSEIRDVDSNDIENVKDDLEVVQEQLQSNQPKKNRLSKALSGIKKFAGDFAMQLAVTYVSGIATSADWSALIQQLGTFIERL